jgi:hypothetical protein
MMLGQSNLRMDDPLSTIREGVDKLGDICLSHLYQFGPPIISYIAQQGDKSELRTLQKKVLRGGIKMSMNGVTVVDNPDAEMARWLAFYAQMVQEPLVAQNPDARLEILRMALRAGRVPNRDKILPSPQEVKEQQIQMMMEAQKRMAIEQAVQGMAQAQEAAKGREQGVRQELGRRQLAKQIVKQGQAQEWNGNAPTGE